MTQKELVRKIKYEVFSRQNFYAILILAAFPPVFGTVQYALGIGSHQEVNSLEQFFTSVILFSLSLTFSISYGCLIILKLLNHFLPWRGNIWKRALIETLLVLSYTALINILVLNIFSSLGFLYQGDSLGAKQYYTNIIFSSSLSLIVLSIYEGIGFFNQWKDSLNLAEKLKKEQAESQLANLQAQLDPHFMFNSLNVLSSLIRSDAVKAEKFLEDFAQIYRYMLVVNKEMVVTLEEELKFAQNYLALQQTRFGEKLQTKFSIDAASLKLYLPPLSLQEIISNALKHNSIEKDHPLTIQVYTKGEELWIENNLQKRSKPQESTGMGLKNISRRYEILSGKKPQFEIIDNCYIAKIPLLSLES